MTGRIGESAWRAVDRVLLEHARRADAQGAHLSAHDAMNEIQNRRIDLLMERLGEAMVEIAKLKEEMLHD